MNSLSVKSKFQISKFKRFSNFRGQFDLEGQGQGHKFSKPSEILRCSMNSLSVKAKFQIGQFKSLKQIFCKFVGQSDLQGQGQGHKFLQLSKTFR